MSRIRKVLLVGSCGKLAGRLAVPREGAVEVRSAETAAEAIELHRADRFGIQFVHLSQQDSDALARFVDRWGTLR